MSGYSNQNACNQVCPATLTKITVRSYLSRTVWSMYPEYRLIPAIFLPCAYASARDSVRESSQRAEELEIDFDSPFRGHRLFPGKCRGRICQQSSQVSGSRVTFVQVILKRRSTELEGELFRSGMLPVTNAPSETTDPFSEQFSPLLPYFCARARRASPGE